VIKMRARRTNSVPLRSSDSPRTATQAVISLWTAKGTLSTSSLIRSTAPASTMAVLLRSLEAARLRSVEMAWHWTSVSSYARSSINGATKPPSMIGDSLLAWIDTLRTQAAADKINGRKLPFSRVDRTEDARRAEQTEQGRQAVGRDDAQLVLLVRGEVAEREGGLALHLEARRVHQRDQALHELGLAHRQLAPIVRVDGDVRERRCAVVSGRSVALGTR